MPASYEQNCTSSETELVPHDLLVNATDLVWAAPCSSLEADQHVNLGRATDLVREACPHSGTALHSEVSSLQQGPPPIGGPTARPRGRSPGPRHARIRPSTPKDDGSGAGFTRLVTTLRGCDDVGRLRRLLLRQGMGVLVALADVLGAGGGLKGVRKLTLVNFILDQIQADRVEGTCTFQADAAAGPPVLSPAPILCGMPMPVACPDGELKCKSAGVLTFGNASST